MNLKKMAEVAISKGGRTFIGSPCGSCGGTLRRAPSTVCVHCDRTRKLEYSRNNREACRAATKVWRDKNKEYLRSANLARTDESSLAKQMNLIASEYGVTVIEVATAWGSRKSVTALYNQSVERFIIMCAGVKELSK